MVNQLLSFRHIYLDSNFYKQAEAARLQALQDLKIVIGTPAKILEGRAGLTTLPTIFSAEDQVGIMVDDFQRGAGEVILTLAVNTNFKLLAGDVAQSKDHSSHQRDAGDTAAPTSGSCKPFDTCAASAWYKANTQVQQMPILETIRLGKTGIEMLQKMWPDKHQGLVSGRPDDQDTLYLPVIFNRLEDWYYDHDTEQIIASETIASHVSVILAVELFHLSLNPRPDKKGILVISILKSFLTAAERIFQKTIPALCCELYNKACEHAGCPSDPVFLEQVYHFDWLWLVQKKDGHSHTPTTVWWRRCISVHLFYFLVDKGLIGLGPETHWRET